MNTTNKAPSNGAPDPHVAAVPKRRQFTAEYKLRILEEADRSPGEVGALLRREGLYSSHLSEWRRSRREGALSQLSKKRGRKPKKSAEDKRVEKLERQVARLQAKLDRAEAVIEVQKKLSEMVGIELPEVPESDEND